MWHQVGKWQVFLTFIWENHRLCHPNILYKSYVYNFNISNLMRIFFFLSFNIIPFSIKKKLNIKKFLIGFLIENNMYRHN